MKPRGGTGLHGREGVLGRNVGGPSYLHIYDRVAQIQALTDIKANQRNLSSKRFK